MVFLRQLGMSIVCCLPLLAGAAAGDCPAMTRVGVSDLGLSAYRDGDKVAGAAVDIVKEVARRAGCKVKFIWLPRQRLFVEMEAGRIDMTMGAVHLPERDAYASYLPYAYLQYDLVLFRRDDRQYTGLADFVAHGTGRLNITRGIRYDPAIETLLGRLASTGRLESVSDFDTVFNKMELGRADGTLASPPIYTKFLRMERFRGQLEVIPLPEAESQFTGIYVSRRSLSASERRNYAMAVKSLIADQAALPIYSRYFDEATVKRLFRLGQAPLAAAVAAMLASTEP